MSVIRRLQFADYDPVIEIDVMPAVAELNALYRASAMAHLQPIFFAAQVGRLSDKAAEEKLAIVYAEAVIVGSPTPGLDQYDTEDWRKWLLSHREEFATIRSLVEVARNFDSDVEVQQNGEQVVGEGAESGIDATD